MPTYYLSIEPDNKGNFLLHNEKCSLVEDTNQFALIENYDNIEDVLTVTKNSDYSVLLCKECIDVKNNLKQKSIIVKILNWFGLKKI